MTHPFCPPVELAYIIDTHRRLFGGLVMMAEEPAETPPAETPPEGKPEGKPEDKLQEGGIKALQAERDARKQLQKEVDALKGAQQTLDKLAEAFAKDGTPDPGADLAAQVAELTEWRRGREAEDARDALAKSVAKAHDITDVTDIDLLARQTDEDAMKALAARLKGVPAAKTPKPDPSQGRGGSKTGRPTSVAQVIEQRRAARAKK